MASTLKRYVIVRDVPEIEKKSSEELASMSAASCSALNKVGDGRVQWQHSYLTDGHLFCVYLADSEEAIRAHATEGGFPITSIHQVNTILDPTTAGGAPK